MPFATIMAADCHCGMPNDYSVVNSHHPRMQRHCAYTPCVNIASGQCVAETPHPPRLRFAWSLQRLPPALQVYPDPTHKHLSCLCVDTWSAGLQPQQAPTARNVTEEKTWQQAGTAGET